MSTVRRALPVGTDHRVLHGVAAVHAVRNRMQLTGFRVTLGVRGVSTGQRSVEVADADGVQLVGEFVDRRRRPSISARVLPACPITLVLAPMRERPECAGRWLFAQRLARLRSAHPAVAVPLGLAVADADAVHHAVAHEPVVELGVDLADRIRRRCAGTARRDSPGSSRSPPGRSACTPRSTGANSPSR